MQKQRNRSYSAFAALLITASAIAVPLLSGCDKGDKTAAIGRLLNDPGAFDNKDLSIGGTVTNRFDPTSGLLSLAAYQVDDGSGKIWVITHSGAPAVGRKVGLKARIRHDPLPLAINIQGLDVTLLDEIERK